MHYIDTSALDGNAAAGAFMEALGFDVTTAVLSCAGCGDQDVFASQRSYLHGPGTVLRCHGCEAVLARVVITPDSVWLDLSGCTSWRLARPPSPSASTERQGS